jgi:hypothetical protein
MQYIAATSMIDQELKRLSIISAASRQLISFAARLRVPHIEQKKAGRHKSSVNLLHLHCLICLPSSIRFSAPGPKVFPPKSPHSSCRLTSLTAFSLSHRPTSSISKVDCCACYVSSVAIQWKVSDQLGVNIFNSYLSMRQPGCISARF